MSAVVCCALCDEMADDACVCVFCVAVTGERGASVPVRPEDGGTERRIRKLLCGLPCSCWPLFEEVYVSDFAVAVAIVV